MKPFTILANGKEYALDLPCTVHEFLVSRQLPPRSVVVEVNGKSLALFNVDGTFRAIDNTCVHRGGPLVRDPPRV